MVKAKIAQLSRCAPATHFTGMFTPEEWPALWGEQKKKAHAHAARYMGRDPYAPRSGVNFTHMSFQIIGYGRKSLQDDLYAHFGPEWEGDSDTWNESYIDYAM